MHRMLEMQQSGNTRRREQYLSSGRPPPEVRIRIQWEDPVYCIDYFDIKLNYRTTNAFLTNAFLWSHKYSI